MKIYVKADLEDKSDMLAIAKDIQQWIRGYKSEWGHAVYSKIEKHPEGFCITVNPAIGQHTTQEELTSIIKSIISECIHRAEEKYPEFVFKKGTSGSGGYRSPRFPCIWVI